MRQDGPGGVVVIELLEGSAVDSWAATTFNSRNAKNIIKHKLQVFWRRPFEFPKVETFADDFVEVFLKDVEFFKVFIYDLVAASAVDKNSTDAHFEDGALEGFLKVVGRGGVVVELLSEDIIDLRCDAAVLTVIHPVAFGLRGDVVWQDV